MNQDERRKLENELVKMGLARLNDPNLIPQMAMLVRDHNDFGNMLACVEPEKRNECYESLRPHLRFEAWPLDRYIAKVKERAFNASTWGEPVEIGANKYEVVPANHATGVIVTLTCHKCGRTADHYGDAPVSAVIAARQDGWVRERGIEKEVCPKCECSDRAERRKCPVCTRRHFPPVCRSVEVVSEGPVKEEEARRIIEAVN